jgi:Zn-dependent M28 family amino/carboxypeptidase
MSLARNSTTANAETELVDVGDGTTDRDYAVDVKGKIVLASGPPSTVVARAVAQKGAAGVISWYAVPSFDMRNRLPGDHPEQVGWGGIEAAAPGQPGRFAFLISARRAQEIKNLLKQGTVRVRATVDAELVPGTLDVVSGIIPGAKYPDEEVVITAHLDHYKPGANDNASGSGAILEMARTMKSLIDAGRLPPPHRTVRFMWVPEYSGTRAWFSRHLSDPVKRVAELNFDMVGENVKRTNAVFAVSYLPDANPSFLNALAESIVDFINRYNDDRYRRPTW